uniref:Uncharacterized protein n=1 Tax=Meloidogyne incognita TaxID=6306 RepID=A0A914MRZ6_MELIC
MRHDELLGIAYILKISKLTWFSLSNNVHARLLFLAFGIHSCRVTVTGVMVHVWVVIELSSHQSVHVHVHLPLFSIDVRHSRINFLFFLLPLRLIGWQIFVFFISQQHIILVTDGLPCSFMKFSARVDALRWFAFGLLVSLDGDVPLRVINAIRQMFRAEAVFLHLDSSTHLDLLRSL